MDGQKKSPAKDFPKRTYRYSRSIKKLKDIPVVKSLEFKNKVETLPVKVFFSGRDTIFNFQFSINKALAGLIVGRLYFVGRNATL